MDEIIYLLEPDTQVNKIGDVIKTMKKKKRYAEVKSIRQSEAYQAAAVGLKVEIMCVIWNFEYNKEEYLIYNDIEYKISRTYITDEEKIELTCIAKVNNEVNAYGNS